MKKEIINIVDELGTTKEVETVAYFNMASNGKDYLIYTENKTDANGNIEVSVSEVAYKEDGTKVLTGIPDDSTWSEVKKVMLEIAKNGE